MEQADKEEEKKPGQDTEDDISAIPYAGMIQIRFNGYDLRPFATPAKYALASFVYRRRGHHCQYRIPEQG